MHSKDWRLLDLGSEVWISGTIEKACICKSTRDDSEIVKYDVVLSYSDNRYKTSDIIFSVLSDGVTTSEDIVRQIPTECLLEELKRRKVTTTNNILTEF